LENILQYYYNISFDYVYNLVIKLKFSPPFWIHFEFVTFNLRFNFCDSKNPQVLSFVKF